MGDKMYNYLPSVLLSFLPSFLPPSLLLSFSPSLLHFFFLSLLFVCLFIYFVSIVREIFQRLGRGGSSQDLGRCLCAHMMFSLCVVLRGGEFKRLPTLPPLFCIGFACCRDEKEITSFRCVTGTRAALGLLGLFFLFFMAIFAISHH